MTYWQSIHYSEEDRTEERTQIRIRTEERTQIRIGHKLLEVMLTMHTLKGRHSKDNNFKLQMTKCLTPASIIGAGVKHLAISILLMVICLIYRATMKVIW